MDITNHPEGKVTINDRAVKQIAAYAACGCNGVAQMSEKTKAGEAAKFVAGKADTSGVYITKTKTGIVLDLYIACVHGADTKALSDEVKRAVTDAFPFTGIKVKDVVVHINDVR